MKDKDPGMICGPCREALEIGRLVLEMPKGYSLERQLAWYVVREPLHGYFVLSDGDAPLEALKKGLGK
jgi:hypothetical protein